VIGALLVSPAAGRGAAARCAGSVAALLRGALDRLDTLVADSPEGSAELAEQAVRSGVDVLVTLGGDGLAHLAVQACAGTSTALAVVPAGTGNDLAKALRMPAQPKLAAEVVARELAAGRTEQLDLGRIADGAWFATVLCAGFDARVSERANSLRWPRGPRRYDVAIVTELARLRPAGLTVRTETETLSLDATMVAVGNTRWYGGGIPICPDASAEDGLFDVTVVGATRRADFLRILPKIRSGGHVTHSAVRTLRARSVRLSGGDDWTAYADGEPQVRLPLTVACVPGALSVVAPR
jgi:diacylglycerol kinase (ATP)